MLKKLHPADAADRAAIATATGFTASIFIGTGQFAKEPASTIAEAREKAAALETKFATNGRTALVYATLPSGMQIVVPKDYDPTEAAAASTPATAPQEQAMPARAKTFPKRFNAQRHARAILKNPKAEEGKQFKTEKAVNGEWAIYMAPGVPLPGKSNSETREAIEKIKRAAQKAASKPTAAKPAAVAKPAIGKRAAIEEAARAGKLPPAPDFSAPTHARYRGKLDEVIKLAKAGDLKGLKAFQINPVSTSPKAIDRYRNLAVIAIEARR